MVFEWSLCVFLGFDSRNHFNPHNLHLCCDGQQATCDHLNRGFSTSDEQQESQYHQNHDVLHLSMKNGH